jgi:aminoglycoside phosphotransferase (APT) family kinase protein
MPTSDHLSVTERVETPDLNLALLAWRRLGLTGVDPVRINVLKTSPKTLACRLIACGPSGTNVVGKRRSASDSLVELTIYRDVLTGLRGPTLRLLGTVEEPDAATTWMFLEDAGDAIADLRDPTHRALAATWLGRLHADLAGASFASTLPDRASGHVLGLLRSARADLGTGLSNPHLDSRGRRVLRSMAGQLDHVEDRWPRIEAETAGLPSTLVHGDLTGKNLRLRQDVNGLSIVPFDWEMSGWGPPLADLVSVDRDVYRVHASPFWAGLKIDLEHLADVGRLFGLLAAVSWEGAWLQTPWLDRPLAYLALYGDRLADALGRLDLAPHATVSRWRENETARTAGRNAGSERTSPGETSATARADTDPPLGLDDLARGLMTLKPGPFGRIVAVLGRAPNPYRTTFPTEIVRCVFDDRVERRLFVKHYIPGIHDGFGYWGGGPYEALMYEILSPLDLGTPIYVGSLANQEKGDAFLVVEFVDGLRINLSSPSRMVDAARWLARFHRDATSEARERPGVRAYDSLFYRSWSQRALEFVRLARDGSDWIEPVVRHFESESIPRLLGAEPVFIHGEFYPNNVLVDADRICVVDWQSGAFGPGEIDLASLTEGWPPDVVDACHQAYVRERWPGDAPVAFDAVVDAAYLYWSMRWLGTSAKATASAKGVLRIARLYDSAQALGLLSAGI